MVEGQNYILIALYMHSFSRRFINKLLKMGKILYSTYYYLKVQGWQDLC